MRKVLEAIRRAVGSTRPLHGHPALSSVASIRLVAVVLLCLCLLGAANGPSLTTAVVIVGGALLALLAQGWALQRSIDQRLDRRIKLHEEGCPVHGRLARIETKLEYIEKAVNNLHGER